MAASICSTRSMPGVYHRFRRCAFCAFNCSPGQFTRPGHTSRKYFFPRCFPQSLQQPTPNSAAEFYRCQPRFPADPC
jgi:hypothetical protein